MKESADGSGRVASQLQGHSEVIYDIAAIVPPAMPYAMRILLENSFRHFGLDHPQTKSILNWRQAASSGHVIDVMASRAFLHDTNGVPVLTDFAAMRDAVIELGGNPELVNPQIPAELTIDHSVIADVFGSSDAAEKNVAIEFERNNERYRFLRWGQKNFKNLKVVPPGAGIMHQINCEYLARVVEEREGVAFPDLCLGTDSHTTMVNGVGVLAWGIGGIEAEAVMLGEAYSMVVPEVVGVRLVGELNKVANATDLVLTITERLRAHGVVGKFVEFFGPALKNTTVADRTTIANMAPEFGSTCAYFPIDDQTLSYLAFTGRPAKQIELVRDYAKHQKLWLDENLTPDYQEVIELDLSEIVSSIAGPRKPQDRISLSKAKASLHEALPELRTTSGTNTATFMLSTGEVRIEDGAVAIAAITSCTNTSNPSVMVAAGLLARKAAQQGIYVKPWVKTTLSPGSKVVTDYLDSSGLTQSLERQGFYLAGYGCMTCIGASGGLVPEVEQAVRNQGLTVAAVLSGNRNFDGRINPDIRLNYLASPPLVVAYALAGSMDIDFEKDELGLDSSGEKVMLKDLWPSPEEIQTVIEDHIDSSMYEKRYAKVFDGNELWQSLPVPEGVTYAWEEESTYLRKPTFMDNMPEQAPGVQDIESARVLAKLGDQITTDHLSPAGAIPAASVAGKYLESLGIKRSDLNTYASRRGNLEVMMRGTLANVRLKNELVPGTEGNQTWDFLDGGTKSIYEAAMNYKTHSVPLIILGGKLYGAGSSRDWGAKGPALLGIRAVIAESFERIHRSNLICMGILPLEYLPGDSATSLGLTGHERFTISDLGEGINQRTVWVEADDKRFEVQVRLETPRERDYLNHGGVLQYVLRKLARP